MTGIYTAAMITLVLALIPVLWVVSKRFQPSERFWVVIGVLGSAGFFFVAFYLLRLPLDEALQSFLLPMHPGWYRFATILYAPLTEEPAKWVCLLPLLLAGKIKQENKGAWAVCLGFGFGMGEIVFLAQHIALADPSALSIPWYYSSGFIIERWMVCVIHSALILLALNALLARKPWRLILPLAFHWLVNYPIFLSRQYPLDADGMIWSQLLWVWNTLLFTAALVFLGRHLFTQNERVAYFLGKAICPECQTLYVRPLWGVNRPGKRYERCPHCKNNHWTTRYVEEKEK